MVGESEEDANSLERMGSNDTSLGAGVEGAERGEGRVPVVSCSPLSTSSKKLPLTSCLSLGPRLLSLCPLLGSPLA